MASEFLRYPFNLGQPPFDKWIKFNAMTGRHVIRSKPVVEQNQPDRAVASVGLYLPTGALKSVQQICYDSNDLGPFVGAAVEALAHGGDNVVGQKGGGSGVSGIADHLKSMVRVGSDALGNGDFTGLLKALALKLAPTALDALGGELFSGLDVQGAAAAAFGLKANPRTEMLFNNQQFREHAMEFMLIPRALDEARSIDRILQFFQFYSLPRYSNETAEVKALGGYMIGFPYEFTVELLAASGNTNVTLTHVNKIGRSVLLGVDFDHAAGGKTAFIKNNGEYYPVATALRLQFREVRLLARGDDEIRRDATDLVGAVENDSFVGPTHDFPDPLA